MHSLDEVATEWFRHMLTTTSSTSGSYRCVCGVRKSGWGQNEQFMYLIVYKES